MGGRTGLAGLLCACVIAGAALAAPAGAVIVPSAPDPPPVEAAPAPAPAPAPSFRPPDPPPAAQPETPAQPDPEALEAARRRARARALREARERIERVEGISADIAAAPPPATSAPPELISVADQRTPDASLLERLLPALVLLTALLAATVLLRIADAAWTLTAGIALSVFGGHWGQLDLPPLDRLVLGLGIVAVLIGFSPTPRPMRPRLGFIHGLLLVVALYALISAVWVGTLGDVDARLGLIDRFGLIPFMLFVVAPLAFHTPRQRVILLGGLTILGGYLGTTALLEAFGRDQLLVPGYLADPAGGVRGGVTQGPFGDPAAMGGALFICAVAAGIGYVLWRDSRFAVPTAAIALLCFSALALTRSWEVWAAAALGLTAALLTVRELRRYVVPAIGVGAFLVLFVLVFAPGLLTGNGADPERAAPVPERGALMDAGRAMVAERPLLGVGWGAAAQEIPAHLDRPETASPGETLAIPSVILSNTVELGLVGATLWAIALLLAIGAAMSRRGPPWLDPWRLGVIAIAVSWVVLANLTVLAAAFPAMVLWTWAGLLSTRLARPGAPPFAIPAERPAPAPGPDLIHER